ncbi:universal stress protein [Maribacter sp. 2307ULW6-5]|uniref:universal stress protein n=1 Tax=Maribacter sp. 2307ULW6-5 TaxID=3386275 RepID=UPI0039BCBB80
MKKVILPTDFSDNAFNAITYAVKLYEKVPTTFYLLNTYTPVVYQPEYLMDSPGAIGMGDFYQEHSLSQLASLKTKLEHLFPNAHHQFVPHSAFNILVVEIHSMVQNHGADLVVMGTQGATGAKEVLLGSHTVQAIKKAQCPILAIPAGFEYEVPKEIMFPTDYELDYRETQLKELLDIARNHISSVEVLHAGTGRPLTDQQLQHKEKLSTLLQGIAHLHHLLPNQNVIAAINSFQQKKRMNLLAMVQNKHTFFERLFLEPVIQKLGFRATIPFLVLPHLAP